MAGTNEYSDVLLNIYKYYGFKDKYGNPIIAQGPNHTIVINTKELEIQDYIAITNCFGELFDTSKPCYKTGENLYYLLYAQTANGQKYNEWVNMFKRVTSDDAKKIYAQKKIKGEKVVFPDFKYFFQKSAELWGPQEEKSFTEELEGSLKETISQNNLPKVSTKGNTGK